MMVRRNDSLLIMIFKRVRTCKPNLIVLTNPQTLLRNLSDYSVYVLLETTQSVFRAIF